MATSSDVPSAIVSGHGPDVVVFEAGVVQPCGNGAPYSAAQGLLHRRPAGQEQAEETAEEQSLSEPLPTRRVLRLREVDLSFGVLDDDGGVLDIQEVGTLCTLERSEGFSSSPGSLVTPS
jgi:hypothetical protein